MPIMPISKAKALELLERQIALLLEKQRAAGYSARSYTYDDYHGIYHSAVVLLVRLFDDDDAEAFRRRLVLPSLPVSPGSTPAGNPEIKDDNQYDMMLGQAILQLELRHASIRDLWPDDTGAGGTTRQAAP
jgi:hypothetical protein